MNLFFYNALSFEHSHYDISSSAPNKEYMEKVYKIATGGYKELLITQSVRNLQNAPGGRMGTTRERTNVYDAWLLSNNSRRK